MLVLTLAGCSSAQMSEIHSATVKAQGLVASLEQHEATVAEVMSAIAAIAPKTGFAPQAAMDAQTALENGDLTRAKAALSSVAAMTEPKTP